MPHKRSKEAQIRRASRKDQRKEAWDYFWRTTYPDDVVKEIASKSDRNSIEDHLIMAFGYGNYDASVVPSMVFKGLIIKDSRGKGSFQT